MPEEFYMFGYGDGQPYFCEDCGQVSNIDIQISNYKDSGENKNVCLSCMSNERERLRKLKNRLKNKEKKKNIFNV